jgi:hypothetical protein
MTTAQHSSRMNCRNEKQFYKLIFQALPLRTEVSNKAVLHSLENVKIGLILGPDLNIKKWRVPADLCTRMLSELFLDDAKQMFSMTSTLCETLRKRQPSSEQEQAYCSQTNQSDVRADEAMSRIEIAFY